MIRIFRNTWSVLLAEEKQKFRRLAFLDIIISILDLASIAVLLLVVRSYLDPGKIFLPLDTRIQSWMILLVYFILFAFKNFAAYLVSRSQHRFQAAVALRLSSMSLKAYQEGSFKDHVLVDTSVQIRKIAFQPFEFCQYHLSGLQQFITQSFLVSATILAILIYNPLLFLLLLAVMGPPVFMVFLMVRKKLGQSRIAIRESNEGSFRFLMDAVHGFVESNIYNCHDFFRNRFLQQRRVFGEHLFQSMSIQVLPARFIEVFAVIGIFLIIAISQWMGSDGLLLSMGAFLAAAYKIIPGTVKLVNITGQMKSYTYEFDVPPAENILLEQEAPREIEFRNVGFSYGDKRVIQQLNFKISQGDFAGIEGRSGIGKTTILNLLLGFMEPVHGKILMNGKLPDPKQAASWRATFSYVKQQSFLIHDTLLRNIILDDKPVNESRLHQALEVSGLSVFCRQHPEGLNYIIAEKGRNISGGQQQRIAIARALYRDPDVILLDEAFNELDEAAVHNLLDHFRDLTQKGKIVIMITHDQESLAWCNKIISLDD